MRSVIVLTLFGLLWFSFAFANMFLGDGRLLPGWIVVGVVFFAVAGLTYAFSDDGGSHGAADA